MPIGPELFGVEKTKTMGFVVQMLQYNNIWVRYDGANPCLSDQSFRHCWGFQPRGGKSSPIPKIQLVIEVTIQDF